MVSRRAKEILEKQHYVVVGEHSAVQICRWTKKSLRDEGVCYKEKFYGIKSHLCCQMTPSLFCPNSCLHCWRAIEFTTGKEILGKINSPKKIIDGCIEAQKKLLMGFKRGKEKNLSKANMKKYDEAQEPMQFAISLSGEPTIYPMIGDLIEELRRRGKTSFLVTNGLYPEKIKELKEKHQLPTQLYVSVNTPNKKMYDKFHRSLEKNAWKKLNETLELLPPLNCQIPKKGTRTSSIEVKTRTVFRINLIKNLNMNDKCVKEFAELVKKSQPMFVECKGYMAVGFARERLGYDRMPTHDEIKNFGEKLAKATGLRVLDEHEFSRVVVLGRDKRELKINWKDEVGN